MSPQTLHRPRLFAAKKPVSPYSGYNGQLLTSVYQPTEMALMHKGPVSATLGDTSTTGCSRNGHVLPHGGTRNRDGARVRGAPLAPMSQGLL